MRPGSTAKTHVFQGVTLQALMSLRNQTGGSAEGTFALQLDPDGVGGLLTTHTPMGDVVVRFSHNSERAELTLTIVKKPMFVPTSLILAQTAQVLRRAAEQASSPGAAQSVSGD